MGNIYDRCLVLLIIACPRETRSSCFLTSIKETSISSQVSNCNVAVLEICLDHKFQWQQEGLSCETLPCKIITEPTRPWGLGSFKVILSDIINRCSFFIWKLCRQTSWKKSNSTFFMITCFNLYWVCALYKPIKYWSFIISFVAGTHWWQLFSRMKSLHQLAIIFLRISFVY